MTRPARKRTQKEKRHALSQTRTPAAPLATVHLDELGRLVGPGGRPVPSAKVPGHLTRSLRVPAWATDIYVYVHGWQTGPASALRRAQELFALTQAQKRAYPGHYPRLGPFRPWGVVVCWPSSSLPSLSGYRRIRDRAHAMSTAETGHAAHVLAHLLGYLDSERAQPGPDLLKTRRGQFLHLVGHSFGGRFLCEAVARAAKPHGPAVAGWSARGRARHPFTVDSLLVFQMAAPRDCFSSLFLNLLPGTESPPATPGPRIAGLDTPAAAVPATGTPTPGAPLRGPIVLTYSRFDRATGFWHLRAERSAGIGHSGVGVAPVPVSSIRLLPVDTPYRATMLDHGLVSVDSSWLYSSGRLSPARAHSDFAHPESAHLLLNLADLSR